MVGCGGGGVPHQWGGRWFGSFFDGFCWFSSPGLGFAVVVVFCWFGVLWHKAVWMVLDGLRAVDVCRPS